MAWLLTVVSFEDGWLELDGDGCLLAAAAGLLSRRDPTISLIARRSYQGVVDVFTLALHRGKVAGEVRSKVDVHGAALAMLAGMQGIEFLKRAGIDDALGRSKAAVVAALAAAFGTSPVVAASSAS